MLNELQEQWCSESTWDFSDLKALFLNCTLKRSPELSHTDGLIRIARFDRLEARILDEIDHPEAL